MYNWKACDYSQPLPDENGHVDDIVCLLNKAVMCGDGDCPLNKLDQEESE